MGAALVTMMSMTLGGCAQTGPSAQSGTSPAPSAQSDTAQSAMTKDSPQSAPQTDAAPIADAVMSGRFEVDPATGKLLNPNRNHTYEQPKELDGMNEGGEVGAGRFAEYFIYVTDYAWNTGDPALIKAVSSDECTWCQETIRQINDFKTGGAWIEHLRSQVVQNAPAVESPDQPGTWGIQLRVRIEPTALYTGSELHEVESREALFNVQLRHDGDAWKVVAAGPQVE